MAEQRWTISQHWQKGRIAAKIWSVEGPNTNSIEVVPAQRADAAEARAERLQGERDGSLRASTVLTIKLGEAISLLTADQHRRYLAAIANIRPDGTQDEMGEHHRDPLYVFACKCRQWWVDIEHQQIEGGECHRCHAPIRRFEVVPARRRPGIRQAYLAGALDAEEGNG